MGVLAAYNDSDLASLRLEARATEEAVLKLEDEKVAIEHQLIDYDNRFRRELGGLLERLLDFRRQRMAREAKAGKVKHTEWHEAEKDYQNLKEEHANANDLPALTAEEEGELKALFRKAAKLCHPDKVAEEHREEASRLFQHAKEAQAQNNIGQLRELVATLERGAFGSRGADKISEKAKIRAIIKRLITRRDALRKELEALRASEPYRVIQGIKDWAVYFDQLRQRMEREVEMERKLDV